MTKRLYKSTEKKLFGVCGGIAEYLNVDPTIIRIAWAILTIVCSGFPGIIAYLVCAFVFPERPYSDDFDNLKSANVPPNSNDEEFNSYFEKH